MHGHLCDGLVIAFVQIKAVAAKLFPDGVVDRTDLRAEDRSVSAAEIDALERLSEQLSLKMLTTTPAELVDVRPLPNYRFVAVDRFGARRRHQQGYAAMTGIHPVSPTETAAPVGERCGSVISVHGKRGRRPFSKWPAAGPSRPESGSRRQGDHRSGRPPERGYGSRHRADADPMPVPGRIGGRHRPPPPGAGGCWGAC
jgi:hypothetical protein